MKNRKGIMALGLAVALVASSVAARTGRAGTPRPTAVEYQAFGAVSLVSGQGARVNITNVMEASGLNFTIQFLDADGQVLKRDEQYLKPGQTGSSEFVPTLQTLSRRVVARAVVESVPDTPEVSGRQVIGNFEVFQVKTQVTTFLAGPQLTLYR
jgi:hypothetical protein